VTGLRPLTLSCAAVLATLAAAGPAGAARPAFPAHSAAGLVRLANYAPSQVKGTYRVTSAGKHYEVMIAALGSRIRIKASVGGSVAEVGLSHGHVVWACGHDAGAPFSCTAEADEDQAGAIVMAALYPATGDFLDKEFTAYFKLPSARVYQSHELGRAVSCFRADTGKGIARTCVAANGMVTETHWRDVTVTAQSIHDHATAKDVARPRATA
jgi:hypothetical protein